MVGQLRYTIDRFLNGSVQRCFAGDFQEVASCIGASGELAFCICQPACTHKTVDVLDSVEHPNQIDIAVKAVTLDVPCLNSRINFTKRPNSCNYAGVQNVGSAADKRLKPSLLLQFAPSEGKTTGVDSQLR
jgi:hypothetical protein